MDLLAWPQTLPRPPRYPLFRAVEHALHRAFPLADDEPEGRLSAAIDALAPAYESPSAGLPPVAEQGDTGRSLSHSLEAA